MSRIEFEHVSFALRKILEIFQQFTSSLFAFFNELSFYVCRKVYPSSDKDDNKQVTTTCLKLQEINSLEIRKKRIKHFSTIIISRLSYFSIISPS